MLPLYCALPKFLYIVCNQLSVYWHFDAASKGIIDTRDIIFYLVIISLFLFLAIQHRIKVKTGKKSIIPFLSVCVANLVIINSSLYYGRFDITDEKQFSVSEIGKARLETLYV